MNKNLENPDHSQNIRDNKKQNKEDKSAKKKEENEKLQKIMQLANKIEKNTSASKKINPQYISYLENMNKNYELYEICANEFLSNLNMLGLAQHSLIFKKILQGLRLQQQLFLKSTFEVYRKNIFLVGEKEFQKQLNFEMSAVEKKKILYKKDNEAKFQVFESNQMSSIQQETEDQLEQYQFEKLFAPGNQEKYDFQKYLERFINQKGEVLERAKFSGSKNVLSTVYQKIVSNQQNFESMLQKEDNEIEDNINQLDKIKKVILQSRKVFNKKKLQQQHQQKQEKTEAKEDYSSVIIDCQNQGTQYDPQDINIDPNQSQLSKKSSFHDECLHQQKEMFKNEAINLKFNLKMLEGKVENYQNQNEILKQAYAELQEKIPNYNIVQNKQQQDNIRQLEKLDYYKRKFEKTKSKQEKSQISIKMMSEQINELNVNIRNMNTDKEKLQESNNLYTVKNDRQIKQIEQQEKKIVELTKQLADIQDEQNKSIKLQKENEQKLWQLQKINNQQSELLKQKQQHSEKSIQIKQEIKEERMEEINFKNNQNIQSQTSISSPMTKTKKKTFISKAKNDFKSPQLKKSTTSRQSMLSQFSGLRPSKITVPKQSMARNSTQSPYNKKKSSYQLDNMESCSQTEIQTSDNILQSYLDFIGVASHYLVQIKKYIETLTSKSKIIEINEDEIIQNKKEKFMIWEQKIYNFNLIIQKSEIELDKQRIDVDKNSLENEKLNLEIINLNNQLEKTNLELEKLLAQFNKLDQQQTILNQNLLEKTNLTLKQQKIILLLKQQLVGKDNELKAFQNLNSKQNKQIEDYQSKKSVSELQTQITFYKQKKPSQQSIGIQTQ